MHLTLYFYYLGYIIYPDPYSLSISLHINTILVLKITCNVKHQFMTHTVVRGTRLIYTNDIVVFKNTTILLVV